MNKYRNENEIAIHSLGRCGSHAIVNWIASMFEEPVYFFNNCELHDPYVSKRRYRTNIGNREIRKVLAVLPDLSRAHEDQKKHYRDIYKQCLIYSYEHRDIRELEGGDFMRDRSLVGRSRNRYRVLILRDFFNWTASMSMARTDSPPPMTHGFRSLLGLWQVYAEEFLGRTDYLKGKVCVSFNRWFADEKYRIEVADSLGLEYSDAVLDYAGSPSSFDARQYQYGGARGMKALDRWSVVAHNANYREYVSHFPEARKLSYEIFGKEIGHSMFYYE